MADSENGHHVSAIQLDRQPGAPNDAASPVASYVNKAPFLAHGRRFPEETFMQDPENFSLRLDIFPTVEDIPPHIIATAKRLGINPEIIQGTENTDAGEVGWLIGVQERTIDGHEYTLFGEMKVEEHFEDGRLSVPGIDGKRQVNEHGMMWDGRIFIFPHAAALDDKPIPLPDTMRTLGYEVLVKRKDANAAESASPTTAIAIDSICVTMFNGGHRSTDGNHSLACDCAGQMDERQFYVNRNSGLAFMGLWEDGRGNGYKAHTSQYHAQYMAHQRGESIPNTYEVFESMGHPKDARVPFLFMYPLLTKGAFGIEGNVTIPTHNGDKIGPFPQFGMDVTRLCVVDTTNPQYYDEGNVNVAAKRDLGGHTYPEILTSLNGRETVTVIELDPEHNIQARERANAKIQEAQAAGNLRLALVFDRDDTLEWTALKHTDSMNAILKVYGYTDEELPTHEDVMRLGNTDKAYAEKGIAEYQQLVVVDRASARFNRDIPLVDDRIPAILQEAEDKGFITSLCLTATPVDLAENVEQGLDQAVQREIPVIGKPEHVALTGTSSWKIAELTRLADANPGVTLVIIDDSLGLARAIQEHGDPRIKCITLTGTLTHTVPEGIHAASWDTLISTLEEVAIEDKN